MLIKKVLKKGCYDIFLGVYLICLFGGYIFSVFFLYLIDSVYCLRVFVCKRLIIVLLDMYGVIV